MRGFKKTLINGCLNWINYPHFRKYIGGISEINYPRYPFASSSPKCKSIEDVYWPFIYFFHLCWHTILPSMTRIDKTTINGWNNHLRYGGNDGVIEVIGKVTKTNSKNTFKKWFGAILYLLHSLFVVLLIGKWITHLDSNLAEFR